MTLIEQIKQIIEDEAERYSFTNGVAHGNRTEPAWHYSQQDFKAGAELLLPVLIKAIEQRDRFSQYEASWLDEGAVLKIQHLNQELLNTLKDGK